MRLGKPVPLLAAGAEPDAEPAATTQSTLPLEDLPPGAHGIRVGVEPRLESTQPVGVPHGQRRDPREDDRAASSEQSCWRTVDVQDRRDHRNHDQGGADIALEDDEGHDEAGHRQQRDQQMLPLVEHALLACHEIRAPEDDGELGELRGLKAERPPELDPVALARDRVPDHEHDEQRAQGEGQQRIGKPTQVGDRHP